MVCSDFGPSLVDLACGIFEDDVREHRGVCLVGQVRAEADTGVEGTVEVQLDGWAELMHRLALEAEEEDEEELDLCAAPRKRCPAIGW